MVATSGRSKTLKPRMAEAAVAKTPRTARYRSWPKWRSDVNQWLRERGIPNRPSSRLCFDLETFVRKAEWKGVKPSRPFPCLSVETDLYIRLANSGSPRHALAILTYFVWATEKGLPIDRRVRRFLLEGRSRYETDSKRNMAKALRLVGTRRGNPGRVASGKRRLTRGSAH
jgi:hypothetical protein